MCYVLPHIKGNSTTVSSWSVSPKQHMALHDNIPVIPSRGSYPITSPWLQWGQSPVTAHRTPVLLFVPHPACPGVHSSFQNHLIVPISPWGCKTMPHNPVLWLHLRLLVLAWGIPSLASFPASVVAVVLPFTDPISAEPMCLPPFQSHLKLSQSTLLTDRQGPTCCQQPWCNRNWPKRLAPWFHSFSL